MRVNCCAQKSVRSAPNFVINAGGIIKVCYEYLNRPEADVEAHVEKIRDTPAEILPGPTVKGVDQRGSR